MRTLDRKLLRDLAQMRGQIVTIAMVLTCGIATFIIATSTYRSLLGSRAAYYETARFADVFAGLKRAPVRLADELAALPGIAELETRIVETVTIDLPGVTLPLSGRMIALPERGAPRLNRLHLRRGRMVDPQAPDEVVVNEAFAAANRLQPGAIVSAILNGKLQPLQVVGIVLSPEYIYATPAGDPIPDDKRFGVFWIGYDALAAAFNMDGAFNDVTAKLAPGANSDAVLQGLDRVLAPYGGLVAYGRDLQSSHRFVNDEITELGIMATTIPAVFLAVAAFLFNIVLARLVHAQREQIAALKALGYTNGAVAGHYLKLVLVIVLLGTVVGIGLGAWLGRGMTESYTMFFRFPVLAYRLEAWVPLVAVCTSLTAGVLGALSAVHAVARLAPAEAMRPPAPVRYRRGAVDRLGLAGRLSVQRRMTLRGIIGRPLRAGLTTLGIALSVPIIIISLFWDDALDYVIQVQFGAAERADMTVIFTDPLPGRAERAIARMPGVLATEAVRGVPVRLRHGHRTYRTAISGLPPGARLRRLLDRDQHVVPLPADGLLLSQRLGERLAVKPGDRIVIEVLEAERPTRTIPIAGLVNDMVGLGAYMDIRALHRLMREADAITAVAVLRDGSPPGDFYRAVKAVPKVATVGVKALSLQLFRATVATLVLVMAGVLSLFSAAIAIGVVYNNARIVLYERAWELASLRVLGFTRAEVSRLLLSEIAVEVLVAVPLGLWLGYWLARGLVAMNEIETFQIPVVISPRTYAAAAAIVLLAGAASALIVRRRIDRLDLVGVLKARE